MAKMGTLDAHIAGTLGVNLDVYKQIKNDPRIKKCLETLDDIYLRSRYMREEQEIDSEIRQLPIPEIIAIRKKELEGLQKIVRNNAAAVAREFQKQKKLPTAQALKMARDANLIDFVPLDASKSIRELQATKQTEQPKQLPVQKKTEPSPRGPVGFVHPSDEAEANIRKRYNRLIGYRSDVKKIIGAEIKCASDDRTLSKFDLKLTREGGSVENKPACTINTFGWSELLEIGRCLKGKQHSPDELAFMKRIQRVHERKSDWEIALQIKQVPPGGVFPLQAKRKATEDAPGHIEKK